ncbi:hypothetical protein AAE478_008178 [Parahypoxylon ruwenzoriense]
MEDVELSIHPVPASEGVLVRVQPPTKPNEPSVRHIPCDIVLVIDVSGSMGAPAQAKMNGEDGNPSLEQFGLSVMDLTKHAARTILSTLNENDRLGIVTFSNESKASFHIPIATVMTNLWHGIQAGISLFSGTENATDTGRVPAVMILTDGQPNLMCPAQGYVPKIRGYGALPATLHTFGFGYEIRSGLLKSIAEIGGGNYSFIPDAGMIGTVFVHAVAHLQTTYATRCKLEITTPKSVSLRTTVGKTIEKEVEEEKAYFKIIIDLGNLQYGQSRDIYLENVDSEGKNVPFGICNGEQPIIKAKLRYSHMGAIEFLAFAQRNALEEPDLAGAEVAYHQSRSMICEFLSSLFPLLKNGEYETEKQIDPRRHKRSFQRLLDSIPARNCSDEYNKSLMEDLVGDPPSGQVSLALSSSDFFGKWGCHYFFSLWNAHAKQLCNSFKDPGPLMYNQNEFFSRCRDSLDSSFDNLPPPKPSCADFATTSHITMSRLNSRYEPCFSSSSPVILADGSRVPVCKISRGSLLRTPAGNRRVSAVLKTPVTGIPMCRVSELLVTPWHPIRIEDDGEWFFPADPPQPDTQPKVVIYSGHIYSVLLQPDPNVDAHALRIGGVWAVTLGHGLVRGSHDVRGHEFLGDYRRVARAIARLQPGRNCVALTGGVLRRDGDGLVCGFKKYVPRRNPKRSVKLNGQVSGTYPNEGSRALNKLIQSTAGA